MAFNRKIMMAVTAVSLSALVISGSLAWSSLNSNRVNVWSGNDPTNPDDLTPTPPRPDDEYGTTLHDDFYENEEYKDVYIENWGKWPVIARIKLSEYMEVGVNAGLKNDAYLNKAESIDGNASRNIDDFSTWTPHAAKVGDTNAAKPAGNLFSKYWTWEMGGQKYYYPVPENVRNNAGTNGSAYVDSSSPSDLTSAAVGAKQTLNATKVVTLDVWNGYTAAQKTGAYWVLGRDGYAYWAQPLQAGQATGLLLHKVTLDKAKLHADYDDKDYYYAINVEARTASVDNTTTEWTVHAANSSEAPAYDNYEVFLQDATDETEKDLIETIAAAFQDLPDDDAIDRDVPVIEDDEEEPVADDPDEGAIVETPVDDAPEEPAEDEPVANAPEEPAEDEPITNAPEEPAEDEPITNAPDEPAEDEPAANAPDEPAEEEPAEDEPIEDDPVVDDEEPPMVVTSETISFTEAGSLVGVMSFSISNVISYDSGKGAIENGGKIVAQAPVVVKYDNSKVVVDALPPFVAKLNVTKEEFDSYAAQKLSGEELLATVPKFENPDDDFQWAWQNAGDPKEFTLQKGFYVIGYFTCRTGNLMDLLPVLDDEEKLAALIIPRVGYFEVK